MDSERKQMITVAVLVGLLVVLFFVGVIFGATRHDSAGAADSWLNHLKGLDPSPTLNPRQLTISGACSLDSTNSQLLITGLCQVGIPPASKFALGGTRRLALAPQSRISFQTEVEGQSESDTIDAGKTASFSFGKGAATLALACAISSPCVVNLPR
jgi:hypothetical protein